MNQQREYAESESDQYRSEVVKMKKMLEDLLYAKDTLERDLSLLK